MPTFIIQYPCRRPADVLDTKTSQSSAQITAKDKSNVKHSGNVGWINLILPGGTGIWLFIPINGQTESVNVME